MQQLWSWRRALLVLAFNCVTLAALPTAHARPPFAHGAVVALQGTPHLWIADEQGTLPVGDPWLSAGLLKDGDPIYLVKWESDWAQPRLLHIQSIADVELFGINDRNYGFEVAGDGIDFSQPRLRLSAAGDSSPPVPAVDRHWAFYHTDLQAGPASASFTLQADQPYRVLLAGEMEVGLSYVAFRWQLRSRSAASTAVGSNARASRSRIVRAKFIGRYRAVS